jgi:phage shock protein PspC (stress-responsive transcriptional regulator)/predicted membrane protein
MSEHTLNPPVIKRLERSRTDKVLAGVSGGLGRYFDLTPAVFRLGFVVLTLLGGAGVLVYIAAVLVMPKEGEERSMAEDILANRREHPARLVALGLIAVAILSLLAHADTWPTAGTAWLLVAVAGLIFLWTRRGRGGRGIVIAIVTVFALLLVTAVAAVTAAFAWFDVSVNDGMGDRTYVPATAAGVRSSYELGIGKLQVDLSHVRSKQPLRVDARLGVGDLKVIVPRDAGVVVTSHVKAGQIDALGHEDDGTNARVVTGNGGELLVNARVGAGHIEVVRAQ